MSPEVVRVVHLMREIDAMKELEARRELRAQRWPSLGYGIMGEQH